MIFRASIAAILLGVATGCWGKLYAEQAEIYGRELRDDVAFKTSVKACHKPSIGAAMEIYQQSSLAEQLALLEKKGGELSELDEIFNHFMQKCMAEQGYERALLEPTADRFGEETKKEEPAAGKTSTAPIDTETSTRVPP